MRGTRWALSIVLCAAPLGACEALAPRNPVKAAEVCGRGQYPAGGPIADLELRLQREDQTVVAEVRTDASGNFRFPPVTKGVYYLTTTSKGWQLGWPVKVTSSKLFAGWSHPMIVEPALNCGGSISKKGYRPKF